MNTESIEFILTVVRLAVPLILVSLSSTLCELLGLISLGTEGLMIMGAFGGVVGSYYTGNPYLGLLLGVIFGALSSSVFSVSSIKYKGNQTVLGVALNLFAYGFSAVGTFVIWQQEGISAQVAQVPNISIPLLKDIPFIGAVFTNQSPVFFITVFIALLIWYILGFTKEGLRIKAISDFPLAVKSVGVNVKKYRYIGVAVSGGLAGLGGAYLSIVQSNVFINGMVAGRGFLGVAANIFGGWTPLGSIGASFVFATAQAIRYQLVGVKIPEQFIQMLPYVITLCALILFGNRKKAPKALGKNQD